MRMASRDADRAAETWFGTGARLGVSGALVSLVTVAIAMIFGWLQQAELALSDAILRSLPSTRSSSVALVGLDDDLISSLGHWPLSDDELADLVAAIVAQSPRAIGIDIYRDLAVPPGTARLAEELRASPQVFGISRYADATAIEVRPHEELRSSGRYGFVNLPLDEDGLVRRVSLYAAIDGVAHESLPMRLARAALEAEGVRPARVDGEPDALQLGLSVLRPLRPGDGPYVGADTGGFQLLLDFSAGSGGIPIVPARSVLERRVPADLFRDRVVLVGSTAESVPDVLSTPLRLTREGTDRTYGALVQGMAVDQILRIARGVSRPTGAWPGWAEILAVVVAAAVGAAMVLAAPNPWWSVVAVGVAGVGVLGGVRFARAEGIWLPAVAPLLALLFAAGSVLVALYYAEKRERTALMQIFGRYVSPEIAEVMWRNRRQFAAGGRPIPRSLVATVLFADLQGFTGISERMSSDGLMAWLDRLMDRLTTIVHRNGGIVDKFIGDAVMAVFGVPVPRTDAPEQQADARAAVRCAVEIGAALREWNRELLAQSLPPVRIRVGIFTGRVVAGSIGSSERLQYTVVGDPVNTAARLESYGGSEVGPLDEASPVRILIGATTYEFVREEFACSYLGSLRLKGKAETVDVYRVDV